MSDVTVVIPAPIEITVADEVTSVTVSGAGGGGGVSSVAVSGSDGIDVDSGSPITTSGTIALGINADTLLTHLNVESGADVTDAANVTAAGALMESEVTNLADVKAFNPASYMAADAEVGADWSVTQVSPTADGASAVAFRFKTTADYTLGKFISVVSGSGEDERFYVNNRGEIYSKNWSSGTVKIDPFSNNARVEFGPANSSSVKIGRGTGREFYVQSPNQYQVDLTALTSALGLSLYPLAQGGDFAASPLTVKGGGASPSATVNQNGGNLKLSGGAPATGGGNHGLIILENLPTADPLVAGAIWNDTGTLKISAG